MGTEEVIRHLFCNTGDKERKQLSSFMDEIFILRLKFTHCTCSVFTGACCLSECSVVLLVWLFPAEPLGNSHAPDLTGSIFPVTGMYLILQHHLPLGVPSKSKMEQGLILSNLYRDGGKFLLRRERERYFCFCLMDLKEYQI